MSASDFLNIITNEQIKQQNARAADEINVVDDTSKILNVLFKGVLQGAGAVEKNISAQVGTLMKTATSAEELESGMTALREQYHPSVFNLLAGGASQQASTRGEVLKVRESKQRQTFKENELLAQIDLAAIAAPNNDEYTQAVDALIDNYQETNATPLSDKTNSLINIRAINTATAKENQNELSTALLAHRSADRVASQFIVGTDRSPEAIQKAYKEIESIFTGTVPDAAQQSRRLLGTLLQDSTNVKTIDSFQDILTADQLVKLRSQALNNQTQIIEYNKRATADLEKNLDAKKLSMGAFIPDYDFQNEEFKAKNEFNKGKNFERMSSQELLIQKTENYSQAEFLNQYASKFVSDWSTDFPQAAIRRGVATESEISGIFLPEVKDSKIVGSFDESLASIDSRFQLLKRVNNNYPNEPILNSLSSKEKVNFDRFFSSLQSSDKFNVITEIGKLADKNNLSPTVIDPMIPATQQATKLSQWYSISQQAPSFTRKAFAGLEKYKDQSHTTQEQQRELFNRISNGWYHSGGLNMAGVSDAQYQFMKEATIGISLMNKTSLERAFNSSFTASDSAGATYYTLSNIRPKSLNKMFINTMVPQLPEETQKYLKSKAGLLRMLISDDFKEARPLVQNDNFIYDMIYVNGRPLSITIEPQEE